MRRNSKNINVLNRVRRVINALIWFWCGTYFVLVVLLNIPVAQHFLGSKVSSALEGKFHTKVNIGKVNLGMLNRIIIDDVHIWDQKDKEMLSAPRLSVKVNFSDLVKGRITISSAQIFGLKANLYKQTAQSKPNFQFVLDALASKDTTKKSSLNLEISSLIIRRGEVAYNQLDDKYLHIFTPKHINVSDISAHIILNTLTNDSLDLNIKRISLKEKSGLDIKKLTGKFVAGQTTACLSDFAITLPDSRIHIPGFNAYYRLKDKKLVENTLRYKGELSQTSITPSDLASFATIVKNYTTPINISVAIEGTDNECTVKGFSLIQDDDIIINGSASLSELRTEKNWNIDLANFSTSSEGIEHILSSLGKEESLPSVVRNIGEINLKGNAFKKGNNINISGLLATSVGGAKINAAKTGNIAKGEIKTDGFDLKALSGNDDLGTLSATISGEALLTDNNKVTSASGQADIAEFTFKNHTYKDVYATCQKHTDGNLNLCLAVNDPDANINLSADYDMAEKIPSGNVICRVEGLDPAALNLTNKWNGNRFDFNIEADYSGKNLASSSANLYLRDFSMTSEEDSYALNSVEIHKDAQGNSHRITLKSDFATLLAEGEFSYETLLNSITNAIYDRLPTLPGLTRKPNTDNRFSIYATLTDTEWAQRLLGLNLKLYEPAHLMADIDDSRHNIDLKLDAAHFAYNGSNYQNGYLLLSCPDDTMQVVVNALSVDEKGDATYTLKAKAADNKLDTKLVFNTEGKHSINGELNSSANFHTNDNHQATADIHILPSLVHIDDSIWNIDASRIRYYANNLEIDKFAIHHGDQHITIDGKATKSLDDEITVELKDMDVSYILGLVNFHSVEFAGFATGVAKGRSIFGKPEADTHLKVRDFTFEEGNLGVLDVKANWNLEDGAINIDGQTKDGDEHTTDIKGYVSPKNSNIDLHVKAHNTRLDFLNTFCDSFLNNIDVCGNGEVNVVGPLKEIQLVGKAEVTGTASVTSLNTTYTLRGDSVYLYPDDIVFKQDTIYDRNGNIGIVNGHLRHKHLGRFTYDIDIEAQNLLAYDTHTFGDDTFYGTAFATGTCSIRGKSGEVVIDIEATPEAGSQIVYNVASPDRITNSEFLTWHSRDAENVSEAEKDDAEQTGDTDVATNMYLNFLIHCNPNATIKLLMDANSGDYIALNGNGVIRATYYNKGSFDMFGNYIVDRGVYKLTIQNVIKRDFEFLSGGTIAFGGDAYNAALNLQAQYTVNGVSLSDINIGKSFSNNNIRVNCLMNISGTPYNPQVDFALDMPTVSSDAKQMIMSLMNSEEEMKQQVVYLLAVGRFLNQRPNNAYTSDASRQSQTSLAMQSILSGTVSQQLSSILDNIVGSNNWNFGANISTGDEGLYNAEYEGLVSGSLLNNRLLVNGQFGYRDNPNATSSFIGDFDIRYLLVPSGSMAVKIYNQANDKYFTKNSLNTQGVGLIMKKDFTSWREFFRFLSKRKKK